jgi:hypothetical protein
MRDDVDLRNLYRAIAMAWTAIDAASNAGVRERLLAGAR